MIFTITILAICLYVVLGVISTTIYYLITGVEDKFHLAVAFLFWPITFAYMIFKND